MSTKTSKNLTQTNTGATKKVGAFKEAWNRLNKQPVAMICLAIVILMVFMALTCDLFFDYDLQVVGQDMLNRFAAPSAEHWFGLDRYGRDLFVRMMYGIRSALLMGGVGSIITMVIATILATVASFYGGRVDNVIMRFCDVLSCIPALVMAVAICASLGGGMWQLVTALSVSGIANATRMVRSKAISVANSGYIESTMALGASPAYILTQCMIPNLVDMIIVVGTGQVAMYIMMGTTLSFIGLGVTSPTPEWGLMLYESVSMIQTYPFQVFIPAIAIVISTLAISTLGDYMRDAFDPRLKGKA